VAAAREIRISSSGDFYFMVKKPEASPELVRGEIQVRVEQKTDEQTSVYQIQIASFTRAENAEDLQKKLTAMFDVPVSIHENSSLGQSQVRVGEFSKKEDAQDFLKTLVASGYRDAFIVREVQATGNGETTLALHGPNNLLRLNQSGFLFLPSSGSIFLCVDGKPYRGSLDIILNKSGRITAVNQLGMEDYLLGVVPAEINPTTYPEFAALAAQSITARTYALYNMGKYRSDGFDLSNDIKTQVYMGAAGERTETSEAVRRTSGLAIYYQDKVINAMYMSTCGGRTEDYSNVFDAPPVPYMKSVFCAVESGPENGETIIEGKHELDQAFLADDGSVANRNVEFARVLGLVRSDSEISPAFLLGQTERDEAARWIKKAQEIAQRPSSRNMQPSADVVTRAGFIRYAAESFFGSDEIRRRISASDVDYYLGNLKDGSSVPEPARFALTYLLQNGLWRPSLDNTVRPDDIIRRGDALSLLLRWIESSRPEILRKGTYTDARLQKGSNTGDLTISIKGGNRNQEFRLAQKTYLFKRDPDRATPVSSLRIIGNEKLAFHVDASGSIDFLEVELNPAGASSDRYSPVSTWDITMKRSVIAEKMRSLTGNIGELKDLKPFRIGNSGRVVQIQAIGSRDSIVLNGYKVRNALGLRDTLFTISREHNPDGSISAFTFDGRGWGHGVGLCQVGAFGMARAGRNYEEIIKAYYSGVDIRKAY
jgi:stage II sporulation protein D